MKILILKKHLRHDLPEYRSYEELRNKIVTAIEGSCGFDGVDDDIFQYILGCCLEGEYDLFFYGHQILCMIYR